MTADERGPRMKTAGVIPARWGSTRFPGKSLAPIAGKPLIRWVIEGARRAKRLDLLIVATDDERIRAAVDGMGVKAVMTRSDHPSGTDRVAEAVRGTDADVIINIQGDEPLIDPALIDRLAETMARDGQWDMGTAACPIRDEKDLANPSVVKVVWGEHQRALYFSRAAIPFIRDRESGAFRGLYWRHIGIYAYRRAFLERYIKTPPCPLEKAEKLEQIRALHIGARMFVLEADEAGIGVDTPEDVQYVEKVMGRRNAHRGGTRHE